MSPAGPRLVVLCLALLACNDELSRGATIVIATNPTSLVFEPLSPGQTATQALVVSHAGTEGTLRLTAASLQSNSADLQLLPFAPVALAPGESAAITVQYAPSDETGDGAILEVRHTASQLAPIRIPVTASPPYPILRARPVAMGEVLVGTEANTQAELWNDGTLSVELVALQLETDRGAPFALTELPALPLVLAPGDRVPFGVRYAPGVEHGLGRHTARVRVRASHLAADNTLIELSGIARAPGLSVSPPILSFGTVAPGKSAVDTVTITNLGVLPVTVSALTLEGQAALTLLAPPETPFVLPPGDGRALTLRFAPQDEMPGPELGVLRVLSDDFVPERSVTLGGRSAAGALRIIPDPVVDLGVVAAHHRHTRTVEVVNAGGAALTVLAVSLDPGGAPDFGLTAPANLPVTLAPGGVLQLDVDYTNPGEPEGVVWSGLRVESDDPISPTLSVSLRARLGAFPECLPELNPPTVEFGTVVVGSVVDRVLTVTNAGSLPCEYRSLGFVDCASSSGPCVPVHGVPSAFGLGLDAPTPGGALLFGEALKLPLRFKATAPAGPRVALPLLTFGRGLNASETLTTPSPYGGIPPVLTATVGQAGIVATPGALTFPLTNPGCTANAATVSVTKGGDAPLALAQVDTSDCGGAVVVQTLPLPTALSESSAAEVSLAFAPIAGGVVDCEVRFVASPATGGVATVHVKAVGAQTADREDTFLQAGELTVDLLFIVDSSGSMGDEQTALVDGFQALVEAAQTWNVSYRIAVTTTDEGEGGRIRRPVATNSWPWSFAMSASVGTHGSGDERGLLTAWLALQPNMLLETGIACTGATACPEGTGCYGGECGGPNRGFVRDEGILALVWVTDEDDHSCETPVDDYVDYFRSLKPPGLIKAYGIIGDAASDAVPAGGCGGGGNACSACDLDCQSQGGGPKSGAEAGRRYHDAVNALGGQTYSICSFGDPAAAPILEAIGNDAFKPNDTFPLSEPPTPSSITVWVAGQPCAAGWTWLEDANAVRFDADSPCFPGPSQAVRVDYQSACQ